MPEVGRSPDDVVELELDEVFVELVSSIDEEEVTFDELESQLGVHETRNIATIANKKCLFFIDHFP